MELDEPHRQMNEIAARKMNPKKDAVLPEIEYHILPLDKIQVRSTTDVVSENQHRKAQILIGKDWLNTTPRFWTSFLSKFGFSDSVFKYFKHQEVFDRICEMKGDTELRFAAQPASPGIGRSALAVSNPNKPIIRPDMFRSIQAKYKGKRMDYHDGVVTSVYSPPSGDREFKIGPDGFVNRFFVETPLDGYGKPSIYLSLLRLVCENGSIAYNPVFRSDITIGDNPEYNMARSLESFDSDEGYSALRQRFEAAQFAPASLWECLKLFRLFKKMKDYTQLVPAYEKVVGDIYNLYGVANLEGLSDKKLRLLPAKCKMYDLINLATEASTHKLEGMDAVQLQSWLGTTLAEEFDLEGTSDKRPEFEGVFMGNKPKYRPRGRLPIRGA